MSATVTKLSEPIYLHVDDKVYVASGDDGLVVWDADGNEPIVVGKRIIIYRGRKPESGLLLQLAADDRAVVTPTGMHEAWNVGFLRDGKLRSALRTESALEFRSK